MEQIINDSFILLLNSLVARLWGLFTLTRGQIEPRTHTRGGQGIQQAKRGKTKPQGNIKMKTIAYIDKVENKTLHCYKLNDSQLF